MAKENNWAVTPNKEKHKYVVGIDLGHGETSAAYAEIGWDKTPGQLETVTDIDLSKDKLFVIPSALAIEPNGDVSIGSSAFDKTDSNLYVCFKKRPVSIDGDAEKLMIRYMREVYNLIRETTGAMLTDDNHVVYIATPSGWDKDTQALYGQMAREAGMPIAGVTWESRAALIKAQSSVDSGLPQFVDKGAVVFDMGSSTLDFTYISTDVFKDNKTPIDFGYDCGASEVERIMYSQLKERNEVVEDFENKYPGAINKLLFKFREAKEEYYRKENHSIRKSIDFYDLVADESLDPIRFSFKEDELENCLKENGYVDKIRNAMVDFKENHIKGKPIHAAFFTGGASRMDFLKDLVSTLWNVQYVFRDQNPSLTISRGATEAARSDLRSGGAGNIKSAIRTLMSDIDVYSIFAEKLGTKIQEEIQGSIAGPVCTFKDGDEDYCLADLEAAIQNNIDSDVENIGTWSKECMEEAFEDVAAEMREKLGQVMANYTKTDIKLGSLNATEIEFPDIDLDAISGQIQEVASSISENATEWTGIVTNVAIGAVAGFLLGPIGWIAMGAYAFFKGFFGKEETEAEKREKAKYQELDSEQRLKVYNEFDNKWGTICAQISDAVSDALEDPSLQEKVNAQCQPILRKYAEECLRQTRLMLD